MTPDRTRNSCGFLTGLLLHRTLGEEPCGVCKILLESGKYADLFDAQKAAERRDALERELQARQGKQHRPRSKRDFSFPGEKL